MLIPIWKQKKKPNLREEKIAIQYIANNPGISIIQWIWLNISQTLPIFLLFFFFFAYSSLLRGDGYVIVYWCVLLAAGWAWLNLRYVHNIWIPFVVWYWWWFVGGLSPTSIRPHNSLRIPGPGGCSSQVTVSKYMCACVMRLIIV